MKKLYLTLLSIALAIVVIPFIGMFNSVDAATYDYSTSNLYEVDYIEDNGTFRFIDDFNDFNDAKALMKTNKDYVVRCKNGYSPTKIVAMNSGLVYSYPRGSSSTQDIYQEWGDNKYNRQMTYVERRYEMTYIDTPYMSAKSSFLGQGYVEVMLNGFDGFADIEYTDLVPSKFIDKGIGIYLGGSYATNSISPYKVVVSPNYYVINKNGNYYDLEYHYHIAYPDGNGDAQEYKLKIDNAANYTFMKAGKKYFSDDGYNFYTDYKKNTFVGTCYNYYQFLPIRTKTNISASEMNGFLKYMRDDYKSSAIYNKGYAFVDNGDDYGFNGALLYALACQESAYGTSGYAVNRNNLFGWNAFDDSPQDASYFSSVDVAIAEMMGRNLRKYADYNDSRYNGAYFGNKGSGFNLHYASDPYWGMKIGAIYYNLDKYSNDYNGKLTDYNRWSLGLIKNYGAGIYYDEACTKKICSSDYDHRQVANIVVLLENEGNSYKIQFSNPISNGTSITNKDGVYGYSWSNSIAYVKANDIQVLNGAKVKEKEYTHEAITSINAVSLVDSKLTIDGIGAISNLNLTDKDKMVHTIKFVDYQSGQTVKELVAETIDSNGFSINDGFDYKYSGFKAEIDLDALDLSAYYLILNTKYDSFSFDSTLRTTSLKYRNLVSSVDDKVYRFSVNQSYSYRTEIDINKTDLNYGDIKKPSVRLSLKQFDSLTFNEDETINFSGYGFIYYVNFAKIQEEGNRFNLHLVEESTGKSYDIPLTTTEISDIYKQQITTDYDITYTGFTGKINLSDLDDGDYTVLLEIATEDDGANYYDINEFNAEFRVLPKLEVEGRTYEFYKGNIRNRLMLKKVSEVD